MARPLRIEYPGAFYHITSRGNERKSVFRSDFDREQFLSYLQSAQERYGAVIHAYCLLNNHYHLLLETPRSNLSQILHHINGAYTTYFNVKRSRAGHLFQGRYRAILVEKEEYAHELSRYIHLNPYRAGMVKNINRYRWSSYPYYLGLKEKPSWLETGLILGYFGSQDKAAVRGYRRFVEEGIKKPGFNPLKEVFASTFLGGPDFVERMKEFVGERDQVRDVPSLRVFKERKGLEEIRKAVGEVLGEEHPLFKKFGVYVSHQYGGHALKEIGKFYRMEASAVSQAARRFRGEVLRDGELKKWRAQIASRLQMLNVET